MAGQRIPAAERFWAKVSKTVPTTPVNHELGPCWIWEAGATAQGYGLFHPSKDVGKLAHRWAYEQANGPIPDGAVLDHLCRVRRCVNPNHLEAVTNEENLRRGWGYSLRNGMRDACVNGHRYTPDNTYVEPNGKSIRCRECARERDRQPHRNAAYRRRIKQEREAA